jgi:predicted RNase H-like HicB family nuclease
MVRLVEVRAGYDDDAKVWYVTHSDVPGVHTEGDTLDELRDKLPNVVRDMVEANGDSSTGDILIELTAT